MNPHHQHGFGGPPRQAYPYGYGQQQQQQQGHHYGEYARPRPQPQPHQQQQWLIQQQQQAPRYQPQQQYIARQQQLQQQWAYHSQPQQPQEVQDLFASIDTMRSGRVSGAQVASLLSRSGLSRQVLRHVWDIADTGRLGSLDIQGFTLALRLIALAQWTGVVAADQADLARHEARTGRPFTMPRFAPVPSSTVISSPQVPSQTVEHSRSVPNPPRPIITTPQPTTTPPPPPVQNSDNKIYHDDFGDFAQVPISSAMKKDNTISHESKREAGEAMISDEDAFGDFSMITEAQKSSDFGNFSTNDATIKSEGVSCDFSTEKKTESGTQSTAATDESPKIQDAVLSNDEKIVTEEIITTPASETGSPDILDQMLGAALRGEDISAKKKSARRAQAVDIIQDGVNKNSAFIDNSSLHTKLSVFDAMAELDVAVATAEWDDFADATTESKAPDTSCRLGDTTTQVKNNDEFGDFDGPDSSAHEFVKIDGLSSASTNRDSVTNVNLGDFDRANPSDEMPKNQSSTINTTTNDAFGAFDQPENINTIVRTNAMADEKEFGDVDNGSIQEAPTNKDVFDAFNETNEDFGDFDSAPNKQEVTTNNDASNEDFGDFNHVHGSAESGFEAEFGDFDAEPALQSNERSLGDDLQKQVLSPLDTGNDIFACLTDYVPSKATSPPPTRHEQACQLSVEEIISRLISKRRFSQVALLEAADRRRQELADTKIAMDAAAKALRFEEAITLRSKLEALEARVPQDEIAIAKIKRDVISTTQVLTLKAIVDTVQERSTDAGARLIGGLERRLGILVGRDRQLLLLDEKLTKIASEQASSIQAWAVRAAARALYARGPLGGNSKEPPVAWSAAVDAALGVLAEGLEHLDNVATIVKEETSLLGEDRNLARKISDLVRSLAAAIDVARSIRRAYALALYPPAPSIPDLDAAARRLSEYATLLDSDGPKINSSILIASNTEADDDYISDEEEDEQNSQRETSHDLPSTLDALEVFVSRNNTFCGLTLRRITQPKTIRYDDQPFFAPAINLWLNLVSLRPPREFDVIMDNSKK
mmetsp:Transcript_20503/g.31307  ORF Transcript_20503/g.31307 Transcript_20503/m.31307 type:complete len:1051 (-) Transcript_20503:916-4068(-)